MAVTLTRIPPSQPLPNPAAPEPAALLPRLGDPRHELPTPPADRHGLSNTDRFGQTSFDMPPAVKQVPGSPVFQVTDTGRLRLPQDAHAAPQRLDLLTPFQQLFTQARERTLQRDREQGFLFSIDQQNVVRLVNPVDGEDSSLKLDSRLQPGQALAGVFHTHPGEKGDPETFTSFSGADIGAFLRGDHPMEVVQTGSEQHPKLGQQYLVLRTKETRPLEISRDQFLTEFDVSIDVLQKDFGLRFAEAIHLNNARLAEEYGYAYYEGHGGRFRKVDFDSEFRRLLPPPADGPKGTPGA